MAIKKDVAGPPYKRETGWSRPRKSQISESLRVVDRIVADMRRDQADIDRLRAETREILKKLNAA